MQALAGSRKGVRWGYCLGKIGRGTDFRRFSRLRLWYPDVGPNGGSEHLEGDTAFPTASVYRGRVIGTSTVELEGGWLEVL